MERLEIIETLKHLPYLMVEELADQPDVALRQKAAHGEWSIAEIVGHLNDNVHMWHKRLLMVCTMTDPQLPGYDGNALVIERGYQDADLQRVIKEMCETRLETVAQLNITADWTRYGSLPGVGRRSLKQLTERAIEHEAAHVAQIRAARDRTLGRKPTD